MMVSGVVPPPVPKTKSSFRRRPTDVSSGELKYSEIRNYGHKQQKLLSTPQTTQLEQFALHLPNIPTSRPKVV